MASGEGGMVGLLGGGWSLGSGEGWLLENGGWLASMEGSGLYCEVTNGSKGV